MNEIKQELRARIREKCKNESRFSITMGWPPQKTYKMLRGRYMPKVSDAVKMCAVLDMDIDRLASFF